MLPLLRKNRHCQLHVISQKHDLKAYPIFVETVKPARFAIQYNLTLILHRAFTVSYGPHVRAILPTHSRPQFEGSNAKR